MPAGNVAADHLGYLAIYQNYVMAYRASKATVLNQYVVFAPGKDPAAIQKVIMAGFHGFTYDMIPEEAMVRLATFVSRGQVDAAAYIAADKSVKGDAGRGRGIFQNTCAACHGFDGKALNWGSEEKPGYVGTEAKANPWEVLHKIRAGHPGVEMPSLMAWPLQDAVDVLAYTRTLPAK